MTDTSTTTAATHSRPGKGFALAALILDILGTAPILLGAVLWLLLMNQTGFAFLGLAAVLVVGGPYLAAMFAVAAILGGVAVRTGARRMGLVTLVWGVIGIAVSLVPLLLAALNSP